MIIVDSGVLVAAVDRDDRHHQACTALLDRPGERFVIPAGVIVEVCWLLGRRVSADAAAAFLRGLAAGPAIEALTPADYDRVADLVVTYRDLPLGTVDAMVVAVAERLKVTTIATIDRRDFTVVRPAHASHFDLLP